MKSLLTMAIAIALTGPATAQTIYPASAAIRYCDLRSMGVSRADAIDAAMRDNWNSSQQATTVQFEGKATDVNVLMMAKYIGTRCPEYLAN